VSRARSGASAVAILAFLCGSALGAQGTPGRTIEFTGLVLVNGFSNSNTVNNSDVPQFVVPDTAARRGGLGGTARQTRLGVLLTQPGVLGGTFSGEVDADFYGGQLGNGGTISTNRPVAVSTNTGALAGKTVVALAAGASHSLALVPPLPPDPPLPPVSFAPPAPVAPPVCELAPGVPMLQPASIKSAATVEETTLALM